MKFTLGIVVSVRLFFVYLQTQPVQSQYCPSDNNCTYGYTQCTAQDFQCGATILATYFALPTCRSYFGYAFTLQPKGEDVAGLVSSPYAKVCPYYSEDTTIPTCLNEYGTTESKICAVLVEMAVLLASTTCSKYYTVDECSLPPFGQEAIAYRRNPNNTCRASVNPGDCTKGGNPNPHVCPRCFVQQCPS